MELPLETQQLCEQYLEKVRKDPEHQLERTERYNIYRSFQPGRLGFLVKIISRDEFVYEESKPPEEDNFLKTNLGDYVISWLGILTVKYVLAEWDLVTNLNKWEKQYIEDVKEMLRDSQALLLNKLDFQETHERLYSDFLFIDHHIYDLSKNLASLHDAAAIALEVVLYGGEDYEMVESALEAYTVIDLNIEGEGNLEEPPIPLEYDLNKCLEFWEWWLSEAIPQAWELAHRTYSKQRP